MLKLAAISVLLLTSIVARAQSECPTLSIVGPTGIAAPGELITFTATIDGKLDSLNLEYRWSVSSGVIESGQGTRQIIVDPSPAGSVSATIEVKGLPEGCTAQATGTVACALRSPEPVKVGTITSFKPGQYEKLLATFVAELRNNPNDQGYIINDRRKDAAPSEIAAREKIVIDALATRPGNPDRSRVTIVRWNDGSGITELWRVPPGAENPVCGECRPMDCPTITVTGPAGVVGPGEVMTFLATVSGNVPKGVKYRWAITDGRITNGQGTLMIQGKYNLPYTGRVAATITLDGLSPGCPAAASERLALAID